MKLRTFTSLILLCGLHAFSEASAQDYPADFRLPLDLPPSSSGSFGELRSNHFHSGLDFRTNRREGYPVYAVADGYISRLRVQVGGFGNAIYITHPNGYSSVYAHLQRFNEQIARTVNDYQYRKQAYDVDFPLLPIEIPVRKGEIIGWSGNTGSSGGPHLHFEFRDSKTEEIINPRLFGFEIPDRVKPTVSALYVYQLNGRPFDENTPKRILQLTGSAGKYRLLKDPVINVTDEVGFGITVTDMNSASPNRNGVYSIELRMDGETIYHAAWERFFFHHSRAINSHIDYPMLLSSGRRIHKGWVEPGDPLTIYKKLINNGIVRTADDKIHHMEFLIKDASGNTSQLNFRIKHNSSINIPVKEAAAEAFFRYNVRNEFTTPDIKVIVPEGNLYNDIRFRYSTGPKVGGGYSAVHKIHTRLMPLHNNYELWLKPDSLMPESLFPKALIVNTNKISQGGNYEDGFVKANVRTFGNYYVAVDTVPPVIRPVNIADGRSMAGIRKMIFRISDNLSGIRSFEGSLNGQWVLMQFDLKTATLWYQFDERTASGRNDFQLVVTDMKLNKRIYNATFYR
ncbi:MAG TPA: M23 family metallopeptidase [Sphingobacteriaceae bacterium]